MNPFPVTASTISAKALEEFAQEKYGLNKNYTCTLFRTGMNHTYFLSDNETKYVLRVYSHNWRSKSEILEELNLLNLLKANHLSVSFPIADKSGAFIQEIKAPEGIRYVVLFSFAQGAKIRFINLEACKAIGALMAKIHNITLNKTMDRISYDQKSLLKLPYEHLKHFFSETLPEMEFIKDFGSTFKDSDFEPMQYGVVHLDIWYDNMSIAKEKDITLFDFDFCGNGSQILDVGYFCKQLFHIETDKQQYELKKESFLEGYQSKRRISDTELKLIPQAGASVYVFYLGVQAQRFDWSNIFLSENYLKMYVGKIQAWKDYYETTVITPTIQ